MQALVCFLGPSNLKSLQFQMDLGWRYYFSSLQALLLISEDYIREAIAICSFNCGTLLILIELKYLSACSPKHWKGKKLLETKLELMVKLDKSPLLSLDLSFIFLFRDVTFQELQKFSVLSWRFQNVS